jgi:hypothetical protein
MAQAQGAIDAARAAGAEQYAADDLRGAVTALAQASDAVAARDYRLALSLALDSRERAQNAAKAAVDARARARGDAERDLAEAIALVDRVETRLTLDSARLPRRAVAAAQQAAATARRSLQEARTALDQEAYAQASKTAAAVRTQIQAVLATLEPPASGAVRDRRR